MPSEPASPPPSDAPLRREDWDPRLGLIRRRGWTRTKASYIRAMFSPSMPVFPLDAELLDRVPPDLPGEVPRSLTELFAQSRPQLTVSET